MKKYWIILVAVIFTMITAWVLWPDGEKESIEFEYVTIDIKGKLIEVKYAQFTSPMEVDPVSGILNSANINPQWVEFYQYFNDYTVDDKPFKEDFFPNNDRDRLAWYRSMWPQQLKTYKWIKDSYKEGNDIEKGVLEGLLFVRGDDREWVIFDLLYNDSKKRKIGELRPDGNVVFLDVEHRKPPEYLLGYDYIDSGHDAVINLIEEKGSGICEVSDPLNESFISSQQ